MLAVDMIKADACTDGDFDNSTTGALVQDTPVVQATI